MQFISPTTWEPSRRKAFRGPETRQSSPIQAQSLVLSWSAAASSREKICLRAFNPGLEENGATQCYMPTAWAWDLLSSVRCIRLQRWSFSPQGRHTHWHQCAWGLQKSRWTWHKRLLQALLYLGRVCLWKNSWSLAGKFLLSFCEGPRG